MNSWVILALVCLTSTTLAFPDGAPIDACVKPKANQPNHSGVQGLDPATSPFYIEASSNYYKPGDRITVKITAPANEDFKGFFLQGRDGQTNKWIGTFSSSPDVKSYPECSSATHTSNAPKKAVTLYWDAPRQGSGNVYFTGTVVKNYGTFWADVVAKVRA